MIIFLYGEDSYRSRQKLNEIKIRFQKNNTEVAEIEAENFDFGKFMQQVQTSSLFSQTRLVVIYDILTLKNSKLQEKIIKILPQISDDANLIFYESKNPDKRSKLFKFLAKTKQPFEFKKLSGFELQKWIKNEIQAKLGENSQNHSVNLEKIFMNSGNDLWKLSNQIEKLSLYLQTADKPKEEDFELLLDVQKEDNVFLFVDALARKEIKKSFKLLYDIKTGANQLYILSMIIFEFRNLLIVKELLEKAYDQFKIMRVAGISPFLAKNLINFSKNFTLAGLKNIYQMLFRYDTEIKTGKIGADLALDLIVNKITIKT